jgi:hypothetical protein
MFIWRDRGGNLMVPYLNWNGNRWHLHFYWLENDFNRHVRIASLRNSLHSKPVIFRAWFL